MKKDYTHICIVLDASGSMNCIADDIKGSFNAFFEKQREIEGETVFDLFQFSSDVNHLVKSEDLSQFKKDLMAGYSCSGCTALNDAVCIAIDTVGKRFAAMPEEERPENVLCVIITDGYENASKEFSAKDVKQRIEHQKNVYHWEFDFLAANQDAWEAGCSMGLNAAQCANFEQSPNGVASMARRMYRRVSEIRQRESNE